MDDALEDGRELLMGVTLRPVDSACRTLRKRINTFKRPEKASYCQIWCTEGWSCDGPAVLGDLDTVVELDPLDHLAELPEAA